METLQWYSLRECFLCERSKASHVNDETFMKTKSEMIPPIRSIHREHKIILYYFRQKYKDQGKEKKKQN